MGATIETVRTKSFNSFEKNPQLIVQERAIRNNRIYNFHYTQIELIDYKITDYSVNYRTLCIIYPKGKRPDLGHSVNNKTNDNGK